MREQSMHDPHYARRVWATFRARRPGTGCRPMRSPAGEASREAERLKDELVAAFTGNPTETDEGSTPEHNEREGEMAMIKLNCGVSRKVGEPNYGSRGASVNVELELEGSAAQDTNVLQQKIRGLFAIAKTAVDEELDRTSAGTGTAATGHRNGAGNGDARPATDSQLRAIRAISERLGLDPEAQARQQFHRGLSELSLPEASRLIDHLKGLASNGQ